MKNASVAIAIAVNANAKIASVAKHLMGVSRLRRGNRNG